MEELKYHYMYPHPSVTTDCVIFGFDGTRLNVLLIERGIEPYKGRWAFPGGFLKMDETALMGAKRELFEETGFTIPEGVEIHEIGKVPYQTNKSLWLFSAVVPGLDEAVKKMKCNSFFTDSFGNRKSETDSFILVRDARAFFKNMQPHVFNEIERRNQQLINMKVEDFK